LTSKITDDKEVNKHLFHQIVNKTFHCQTGAFLKFYKSKHMLRGTKGEKSSGIRETLKHATGANATSKKTKKE